MTDVDDAAACEHLAMQLLADGDPAAALPWAERAAALADEGGPHNLLGMVRGALGQRAGALAAYARAAALAPDRPAPHFNCAVMAEALGDRPAAIAHVRRARALDPDDRATLVLLARLLTDVGDDRSGELEGCLLRLRALDPDDAAAHHLLDGVRGHVSAAPPRRYVTELFDAVADDYDAMMVDRLGYRGHVAIAAATAALGPARFARALDLGCGTGLVGAAVRPYADWLAGVDLAPRMIAQAQARRVYDRLDLGDVVEHLGAAGAPLDLVVAADVLIYLGDLAPLFAAVRARLAPGGAWIFTAEESVDDDVRLHPSGRYAHHRDHLARTLAACRLAAAQLDACVLRTHLGEPVAGLLVVARSI